MAPKLRLVPRDAEAPKGASPGTEAAPPERPALTPEQRALVDLGMPLVEHAAAEIGRRYRTRCTAAELLGPGTIALCEAAVAYRQDGHPSFLEYAKHHVRGRMLDAVHAEHFSLRARVEHAMERAYCRISSHQVADFDLFADPEEKLVEGAQRGCDDVLAAAFLAGLLEAQEATPEEQVMELEGQVATRASLQAALAALYPHEREVIHLLYEKGRRERVTLDDVAREIGVHESTAQRRHVAALRKLREQLAKRGITRSVPLPSLTEADGDGER